MQTEFKREPRYIVFKLADVRKYLTQGEIDSLMCLGDEIAVSRVDDQRPPFNAVVVEQDWPEFEPTWAAIEARMIGQSHPLHRLGARLTELLDEAQWAECKALLLAAGILPANLNSPPQMSDNTDTTTGDPCDEHTCL